VEVKPKNLTIYETDSGKAPFSEWFNHLKDRRAKTTIDARLTRLRRGNLGLCRDLKGGLWELKIDFGPGYRVYFGLHGETVVVLLHGGDKSTQTRDIETAREFWTEYLNDQKS